MIFNLRKFTTVYRHTARWLIVSTILAVPPAIALAETPAESLPAPAGDVLLRISGNLTLPNVGDEAHLDMALLESFPLTGFATHTPWSDDLQQFAGVRISDLFKAVGASSADFTAIALDDYKFTVTDLDIDSYPVIIAYLQDDKPISVRQLGPLRIMFPFDDHPALRTHLNESSAVWQLLELTLP